MRLIAMLLLVTVVSLAGLTGCFKANVNVPDYSNFGRPGEEPPPVQQAVPNDLPGLQHEVLALRSQNAELRAQNEDFRGNVGSLEKKVDKAKNENDKLKNENKQLKDENKKFRKMMGKD